METHEQDPTTESTDDPWSRLHGEFGGLGERLKDTYRRVAAEGGPTEDDIKEAVGTLMDAWGQVAESVTTALQDPEVRERLKTVGASFASAVGATISELGSEFGSSNGATTTSHEEADEDGSPSGPTTRPS